MLNISDIEDVMESNIRRKGEKVVTRHDYLKIIIKHWDSFSSDMSIFEMFTNYFGLPNDKNIKQQTQAFRMLDAVSQAGRNVAKILLVDAPILFVIMVLMVLESMEFLLLEKLGVLALLIVGVRARIVSSFFYVVDHIVALLSTFISSISGSGELLAIEYLKSSKDESDRLSSVYFDKSIDEESRILYEEWIEEIIEIFPILSTFHFNIVMIDELSNIANECRKVVAVYDLPYQKVYDDKSLNIGAYNPAGATVICKNMGQGYFESLIDFMGGFDTDSFVKCMGLDVKSFRKHILYHEICHLITISIDSRILSNLVCVDVYEKESNMVFPGEHYLVGDIKEYYAECLSRYVLYGDGGFLGSSVEFTETKTFEILVDYIKRLNADFAVDRAS